MVIGEVEEASAYVNKAGEPAASIEITARLVKFLSSDSNGEHMDEEAVTPVRANGHTARRQLAEADIPF